MKLLDKIYKALGFESEEGSKEKYKKSNETSANFVLDGNHHKRLEPTRKPMSQLQVQEVLDEFKRTKVMIIDFSGFSFENKVRAVDFVSGAVFALEGEMKRLEEDKFRCQIFEDEE